jgi:hypothetical protein
MADPQQKLRRRTVLATPPPVAAPADSRQVPMTFATVNGVPVDLGEGGAPPVTAPPEPALRDAAADRAGISRFFGAMGDQLPAMPRAFGDAYAGLRSGYQRYLPQGVQDYLGSLFTRDPQTQATVDAVRQQLTLPQTGSPFIDTLTGLPQVGPNQLMEQLADATTPGGAALQLDLPGAGLAAAAPFLRMSRAPTERIGERLLVSTRFPEDPIRAAAAEQAGTLLTTGMKDAAEDPAYIHRLAEEVRRVVPKQGPAYPMLTERERGYSDQGILDAFVGHGAENLDALIGMEPPRIQRRAGGWYQGARKIGDDEITQLAVPFGISRNAAAGVLATQSAGTEWPINIEVSKRLAKYWRQFKQSDEAFTRPLFDRYVVTRTKQGEAWIHDHQLTGDRLVKYRMKIMREIDEAKAHIGFRFNELSPEHKARMIRAFSETNDPNEFGIYSPEGNLVIPRAMTGGDDPRARKMKWQTYENMADALSILDDPSDANISARLGEGHKIRNFYNDISVPEDPRSATSDVHNIAGTLMLPVGGGPLVDRVTGSSPGSPTKLGFKGAYPLYQESTTRAAQGRGLVPNQGQSISWEAVKGLFTPEQRRDPVFMKQVVKLWNERGRGRMSPEEFYGRIYDLAASNRTSAFRRSVLGEDAPLRATGLVPPEWSRLPKK